MVKVKLDLFNKQFIVIYEEVNRIDNISFKIIHNLLVGAIEGGYPLEWAYCIEKIEPKEWTYDSWEESFGKKIENNEHYIMDYAMNEGGALIFVNMYDTQEVPELKGYMKWTAQQYGKDIEWLIKHGKKYKLNLEQIKKAIEYFVIYQNERYEEIINDNFDAIHSDGFFQVAVLDKWVYG